jgi:uncharacterized RDD family membrane protein YckC
MQPSLLPSQGAESGVKENAMICAKCGAASTDGAAFCRSCGQPIVGFSVGQSPAASSGGAFVSTAPAAVANAQIYAGFWLRFVAYLIDSAVAGVVVAVLVALAIGILGIEFFRSLAASMQPGNPVIPVALIATFVVFGIVMLIASWLYFAGMESSAHQGTLGKMALGLKVTDMIGQPVSFGRASGRFFSQLITGMVPLAIGYIMAGFTQKKQALHDMIASCLVLRKA